MPKENLMIDLTSGKRLEPSQDGKENAYMNSLDDYTHKDIRSKGIRSGYGMANQSENNSAGELKSDIAERNETPMKIEGMELNED